MAVHNSEDVKGKNLINELTTSNQRKRVGAMGLDMDFNFADKKLRLSDFNIDSYSDIIVVYNFKKISKLHYSELERSNQMMELYYHIGRLYELDGKSIYKLQNGKPSKVQPLSIDEE